MKKKLLIAAGALLLLVVGGLIVGVAYSGDLLKLGIETGGTQAMKTETTLDNASLSLLGGSLALNKLEIKNPEGFANEHAFSLGSTSVDLSVGSLLSDTIEIEQIAITSPHVALEVSTDGTNLGALLGNLEGSRQAAEEPAPTPTEEPPADETPAEEQGAPLQLVVRKILILDAKVILTQSILGESSLELTLPKLELTDVGTEQDPASLPEMMQQVVAAVMAGVIASDQIPPELAALLRGELLLPSLDALKAQLETQLQAGLDSATQAVQAGMGEAKDALNAAGKDLGAAAGKLGESAGAKVGELGESTGLLGENAGEKADEVGENVDQASDKVDEEADKLGDAVDEEAEKLGNKLGGMFGK